MISGNYIQCRAEISKMLISDIYELILVGGVSRHPPLLKTNLQFTFPQQNQLILTTNFRWHFFTSYSIQLHAAPTCFLLDFAHNLSV